MNFDKFPIQQLGLEKQICVLFASLCWCQKKKSKTVMAIYVYTSESSCFTLLKNGIVYYAMTYPL